SDVCSSDLAELPGAQSFQCPFARSDRHRIEALAAQKRIEQAALAGIIIDDQDARRFRAILAGVGWHWFNSCWPRKSRTNRVAKDATDSLYANKVQMCGEFPLLSRKAATNQWVCDRFVDVRQGR